MAFNLILEYFQAVPVAYFVLIASIAVAARLAGYIPVALKLMHKEPV